MLVRSTGYNTGAQDITGIEKDDDYRPLGLPRSKKVVVLLRPARPNGLRGGGCVRVGGGAKGGGCCRAKLEGPG